MTDEHVRELRWLGGRYSVIWWQESDNLVVEFRHFSSGIPIILWQIAERTLEEVLPF